MSVSSSKSNPHAAYVEDCSDSQDEKSDKRPPPNSARKVTRRDEASDSGYSSKTHATGSSSQSTKAVKPTKPAKQSTPQKLKTMAKKVTVAAKKSASKEAKEVKEAAAAPVEAKRRPSILKQPKGSSDLRRSLHEVEDQETAARMKLSGDPVQPRRASTARPKIEGYAPPPPQTVAAPPPAQSITIPKPQSRPVMFALQPRPRPHSYHPGMATQAYTSRSLPTHTTPYPYPPPQTFLVPVHQQPQPQSTPQPMLHMQQLPPPQPPLHPQPAPHQGGNVYVMPSGPSSPRSTINYNFRPTQIPQQHHHHHLQQQQQQQQQQTYFQPNPSQQGYWEPHSYQPDQATRRMSASFIQQRNIPEYPQIPQPSRIQHQHQPPPSHGQPHHPPQPRPSYPSSQVTYHEPMVRTTSLGRHPSNSLSQGHHAAYQETFYMDDFEDDDDEYDDPYEMDMRRAVDERAARARIAMPPPSRPPLHRSDTTSVVHRSGSQRHRNRGSIEFSLPSPTRRSLEGTRPLIYAHPNGNGRPSFELINMPEAPPSPNTLRRRSRPVSFQDYENQERSAEAYQYYQAIGQSPHPTREDLEDTERALTKRNSRAKNGISDTTSRASSRSDKKSRRADKHRYDDETLTLQMNGMTLGVRGTKGTVNIKMADGESKSRSVSRSQTYHASEGTGPEMEVHRSSRTRSRSAAVPQEQAPNSAVTRLKNNSKSTSRRSSSSRAAPPTPVNERMEQTGIPGF